MKKTTKYLLVAGGAYAFYKMGGLTWLTSLVSGGMAAMVPSSTPVTVPPATPAVMVNGILMCGGKPCMGA